MRVLDLKEQSIMSFNETLSALKYKKESLSGLYSSVREGHKIKLKQANGDYYFHRWQTLGHILVLLKDWRLPVAPF